MNYNSTFLRKVGYITAVALLLLPLHRLGQPATQNSAGGTLTRMRADYGLSQAALGDIDPASETMRMATLGLRGVAVSMLWQKANKYKKTEEWDNLSATLNQIAKLQPNFISVWEFQAHNLSYNVSVEFDDYRHRYHWVKKGIEFLIEGTSYNHNDPRLLWNLGWFSGQKIGRADEHVQFRRLFAEDRDFHTELRPHIDVNSAYGMTGRPDNWLVGYLWFRRAQAVDRKGVPTTWLREGLNVEGLTERRRSPVIFHSDPPMTLINYASTAEKEGFLDEKAQRAWMCAARAWSDLGNTPVTTSWGDEILLNDFDRERDDLVRLRTELDALVPGVREKLREERYLALTEEERVAYDTPRIRRTPKQMATAYTVGGQLRVEDRDISDQASEDVKESAQRIVNQIENHRMMAGRISTYRQIVNYYYWRTRCAVEQTDTAIKARKHVYDGQRDFENADLLAAKENFELAWSEWADLFEQEPALMHDVTAKDLLDAINQYRILLGQLDEPFPEEFPLNALFEAQAQQLAPQHFEVLQVMEAETTSSRNPVGQEPDETQESESDASDEAADREPSDDGSDETEPADDN